MNKGRRNELAQLKRRKRLRHLINGIYWHRNEDGQWVKNPKLTDIPKNQHTVFKSTGTPCSCDMCSPGKVEPKAKYNPKFQKERV